jgi:hypothetical protein
MSEVFEASTWTVELPDGWSAERDRGHVQIRLPFDGGALRFTPYNDETGQITANDWLHATEHFNRKRGRPVIPRQCGSFVGYETPFATGELWIRGWVLVADNHGLDVDYRCAIGDAGRDDSAVDAVLSTLRLRRAAT